MSQSTPRAYHRRHHKGAFDECWACGRALAVCNSRRRYVSPAEADAVVDEIRERENFSTPTTRYRCRWCQCWHLTSHPGAVGRRRHEKQRRKALVKAQA